MDGSLHRRNWLHHWPLVVKLKLQPLSTPQKSGDGTKNSNSLFMIGSPGDKPGVLSKSPLININPVMVERGL